MLASQKCRPHPLRGAFEFTFQVILCAFQQQATGRPWPPNGAFTSQCRLTPGQGAKTAPCGQKPKTEDRSHIVTNSKTTLKRVHLQKKKRKKNKEGMGGSKTGIVFFKTEAAQGSRVPSLAPLGSKGLMSLAHAHHGLPWWLSW